jgi:hypothetical protein
LHDLSHAAGIINVSPEPGPPDEIRQQSGLHVGGEGNWNSQNAGKTNFKPDVGVLTGYVKYCSFGASDHRRDAVEHHAVRATS